MKRTFNVKNPIKILALLTAIIILVVTLPSAQITKVSAQTVQELRNQISQLQKEQQKLNSETKGLQDSIAQEQAVQEGYIREIANVKEQLDLYQKQIDAVNVQIAQNITAIDQKNADIGQKNVEIDQKNVEIDQKTAEHDITEDLFLKRLDAMYIANSENSVLGLIFGARTFSEFLTITEVLKSISMSDQELMQNLSRQKTELQGLKTGLETAKAEIETAKAEIEVTKAENESYKAELVTIQNTFKAKTNELSKLFDASAKAEQSLEANKLALDLKVVGLEKEIEASQGEIEEILRKQQEAENNKPPAFVPSSGFAWPTPGAGYVSSGFGPRWGTFHYGMDIAAPSGTPIIASKTGTVVRTQNLTTGYGKNIILSHGDGTYTLYAHCSSLNVTQGQVVQQGDKIAAVGTTGDSTGNHLHFEIRLGPNKGDAVDPAGYVSR